MKSSETRTKSEKSNFENVRKIIPAVDKRKSEMQILNHPIRTTNKTSDIAIKKVNSLNPNKPQPITLKKNTLLKLEKKIREVENTKFKSLKNVSDLPKPSQTTLEEKITKHMNFPIEKKIYKQLISLNLTEKQPIATAPSTFEPTVKDREPKLENYFNLKSAPQRPIPVSIDFRPHTCTRTYNAFKIHQIMESWNK